MDIHCQQNCCWFECKSVKPASKGNLKWHLVIILKKIQMEQLFKNIAKDFRKLKCEQNSNCGFGKNVLLVLKCQTPWPNRKKNKTKTNKSKYNPSGENVTEYQQAQPTVAVTAWVDPTKVCLSWIQHLWVSVWGTGGPDSRPRWICSVMFKYIYLIPRLSHWRCVTKMLIQNEIKAQSCQ